MLEPIHAEPEHFQTLYASKECSCSEAMSTTITSALKELLSRHVGGKTCFAPGMYSDSELQRKKSFKTKLNYNTMEYLENTSVRVSSIMTARDNVLRVTENQVQHKQHI